MNGHMNRNIRLLVALMQATQPNIEVLNYIDGILYWRVVGCAIGIDAVGFELDDEKYRYDIADGELCFWEGDQFLKSRESAVI